MADRRRPDGSYGPEYGPQPPELEYAAYHQFPFPFPSGGRRVPWPLHRGDYSGRLWEQGSRRWPFELSRHPLQPYAPFRIHQVHDGVGSGTNLNPRHGQEDPGLTEEEFRVAMEQLRKQEYRPSDPKKKQGDRKGLQTRATRAEAPLATTEEKACTICLDAFLRGEQVVVTPCNHIFHQGCITLWLKGHGNCPVCRFALCQRRTTNTANSGLGEDGGMDLDLLAMMRAMEEAFSRVRLSDSMSYYHQ